MRMVACLDIFYSMPSQVLKWFGSFVAILRPFGCNVNSLNPGLTNGLPLILGRKERMETGTGIIPTQLLT